MPTYDYFCDIHKEFEISHSIRDEIIECPKCKEEGLQPNKIKRLISAGTGFILKGGCWSKDSYG
jgi:putative FmdB family regulatory protein